METRTKSSALGAKSRQNSLAMWDRARKVLAGGVGHAKGSRKWDVDQTVEMFDDLVSEMVTRGVVPRL